MLTTDRTDAAARPPATELLRSLVVGAGAAGRSIARDLQRTPEFGLVPVAFLDDTLAGHRVAGLRVLGTIDDLERVARAWMIDVVILAIPALEGGDVRRITVAATAVGASVRYLPSFLTALERDARVGDLRSLQLSQLLGRSELHVTSAAAREALTGKRVLVTGAGGSIGSELCRQVASCGPEALFLLDHDESNLHRLQLELTGEALLDGDELVIADIRDQARIQQVFEEFRPQVVFHAAAHKHLPLLEKHPCEGVKSNVFGTQVLVEAALESGTDRFILISTDKAADPTSVLGATKRLAELVVQANAVGGMRLAAVRFGNVLGSRGSLLHSVAEQVSNGEAVTVTHPDVTRFFMTVEEAVGLVIEAGHMADMGEIFVLDMGQPVRIVDLVRNYASQLHLPESRIRFTGLRPGEKLHEALFSEQEECVPTAHPRIFATRSTGVPPHLALLLDELYSAAQSNARSEVRRLLTRVLPCYEPAQQVVGSLAAPYPDGY